MEEIQFIEKGESKNCLLLIHGFCSGPEDWEDQINFFCADFTVLAPTLRGHDGNNYKNRPMSIEQLSNDCVTILNKKSFNRVVIAGHSMGTRLAIDIASKINNVAGLILVDGSRFCDYEKYFEVLSNFENSLKQNNYQSLLKNMFSSMFFSESYKKDRDRIVKRAINIPERYSLPLRRNTIWYDSHCVENNLKSLKLPILVIQSTRIDNKNARCMINKDDDIYYVNFINNFNKDNDIVLLENTGHYITIERPQWINETILSWLIKLKLHFRK